MRIVEGTKELIAMYDDYRTMDKEDLADFYKSKCDYYQKYVEVCLVCGALVSFGFIIYDYLVSGSWMVTLIPRLSFLPLLAIFVIVTWFNKSRAVTVFMDFFLGHGLVIICLWIFYCLQDKAHANEFFVVMNIIWIIVGYVTKPHEMFLSYIVFFAEILISSTVIQYPAFDIILAIEVISGSVVIASHMLLTLYYLDHYRMLQQLELAMVTDPLTQVYNRHLLEKIITKNTLKDIPKDERIAVVMIDIDNFKNINDDFGHYTGDLTLLYIGQKLSNETHNDDYVIRYGGEEFVVILRNCDVNNACARMEQFRRDIENAKDMPVKCTVSIGVARYAGDFSKTIRNVDTALYRAKSGGRNQVVVQ